MENKPEGDIDLTPFTAALERFKATISYTTVHGQLVRHGIAAIDADTMLRIVFQGGYHSFDTPRMIRPKKQ